MDEPKYQIQNQQQTLGQIIGDHPVIHQHFYSTGANNQHLSLSEHAWNVPYHRNPYFIGREDVLQQLHYHFTHTKTTAITQSLAITGLGGIGKTQVAIEYVHRYREEYQAVLWVRADTRDTITADFVTIASLLHLPQSNEQDQTITVNAVRQWLARNSLWLLVLDNVEDLELVRNFIPTAGNGKGHIILITRAYATGWIAKNIVLEKMTQDEGLFLLLRRSHIHAQDILPDQVKQINRRKAEAIITALDGLPLALDQAGAYIEETGCSISDYLDLYQTHRAALLRERGNLASAHPDSVSTTFSLAFQKVQETSQSAAKLLELCAFLYPDVIPEEIFTDYVPNLDPSLQPLVATELEFNTAIKTLLKFSLIQRSSKLKMLTIHRLVQAVLQDEMEEQIQRYWEEYAVRSISRSFPFSSSETWSKCQRLLPHAYVCTDFIAQGRIASLEAAGLLYRMGRYLKDRGQYAEAEIRFQEALPIAEKNLESQPLQVENIRSELAVVYHAQGKYDQAESLHVQVLESYQKILGLEHPEVAHILDNLAGLYRDQGRYTEAESFYHRALKIRKKVLGPEHTEVGATLNNLALLYYSQGKYTESESLYLQALKTKVQGRESINLSSNLCNLAETYRSQGKYKEAESLSVQALEICERIQGPEHPEVAIKINNLGLIYYDQRKYAEAEVQFQRALRICENTLEPNHPTLAQILTNLGSLYLAQGKHAEAEPFLKQAWAIGEMTLGPIHPNVATYLSNLAILYHDLHRNAEAESFYKQAISIWENHDLKHPLLAGTLKGYAILLRETKQESRAMQAEAEARAIEATIQTKNKKRRNDDKVRSARDSHRRKR